jgi:serine protease
VQGHPQAPWGAGAARAAGPLDLASLRIAVGSTRTDRRISLRRWGLLASVALALFLASPAEAGQFVPGELIVHYRDGTSAADEAAIEADAGTVAAGALPGGSRRLAIADGQSVAATAEELRGDPRVGYAVANYRAQASGFQPNDPGFPLQWNFWGPFGIRTPEAWSIASRRGAPGGRGAVVAVLDTGIAYRSSRGFRRAPDLRSFVRGYDFVDNDRYPFDLNGHGTHVAGTIGESTNNGIAVAGIAYRARIMPVRTLDSHGGGDAVTISRGIRYAARHHADVINLSLEFAPYVQAADVPDLLAALRYAHRRGVVVTAVAGNEGSLELPYPGRAPGVIAVAATTEGGCAADYSNAGSQVDVAAPGGGDDAPPGENPWDLAHCHPGIAGRSIFQQTFAAGFNVFGLPAGYYGTSMAAPHVAGLAALVIASKRLGRHPNPDAVARLIERTARDAGSPGYDVRYGHGLIDAAAALR